MKPRIHTDMTDGTTQFHRFSQDNLMVNLLSTISAVSVVKMLLK
jgi:hypothetical protein